MNEIIYKEDSGIIKLMQDIYPDKIILEIKELNGLSNKLFYVKYENEQLVIRIRNDENQLKREVNIIESLSKIGQTLGIKVVFQNGYITEYIQGKILSRTVDRNTTFLKYIARKMYDLHNSIIVNDQIDNIIWDKMFEWIEYMNEHISFIDDKRQLEIFYSEIIELKLIIDHDFKSSDLVLCHNDLAYENILFDDKNNTIMFIDWEYCGKNYPMYDIANFFQEWAGNHLKNDLLLNDDEIDIFLTEYYGNEYIKNSKDIKHKINIMKALSDLHWSIWAYYRSTLNNEIGFDYKEYGRKRYLRYLEIRYKNIILC